MSKTEFLEQTVALAARNVEDGGWPFATLIVRNGDVIAEACNGVHRSNDPTDHAEIAAIRKATAKLGTPDLSDCEIYMVAPPCPMCMGAIILSGIKHIHCVMDLEEKDSLLTELPLSLGLYDKISQSLDGEYPKVHIQTEHGPKAASVLRDWNAGMRA